MLAITHGHHETVELLLGRKADVNVTDRVSRGEGTSMGLGGHASGEC